MPCQARVCVRLSCTSCEKIAVSSLGSISTSMPVFWGWALVERGLQEGGSPAGGPVALKRLSITLVHRARYCNHCGSLRMHSWHCTGVGAGGMAHARAGSRADSAAQPLLEALIANSAPNIAVQNSCLHLNEAARGHTQLDQASLLPSVLDARGAGKNEGHDLGLRARDGEDGVQPGKAVRPSRLLSLAGVQVGQVASRESSVPRVTCRPSKHNLVSALLSTGTPTRRAAWPRSCASSSA